MSARSSRASGTAALLAAALLCACSPPRDVAGLSGTYVMSKPWNADTLVLRADGRYVRRFKAEDAPQAVDSGAWFLTRGAGYVGLRAFPKRWAFVHDLMGDTTNGRVLTTPTMLSLSVRLSWRGVVRLGWYPEFNWWYVRVR